MQVYRHPVRVQWGDCDPARIVFYPNYYCWMDEASQHLFESVGLGWTALREKYDAPGLPLISTHAEYRAPGYFGDDLIVEAWVSDWGTKSLTISHRIVRGETVLVEGYEKRIWSKGDPIDHGKITPVAIPEDVKALLS